MRVLNKEAAWDLADRLFPTDYEKDEDGSETAGYPIYRSTADDHYYDYICDLGNRLELNYSDRKSENIWIGEKEYPTVFVGCYTERFVFEDVKVPAVEEIRINGCKGMTQRKDVDNKHVNFEFIFANGGKHIFPQDSVAYVRFEGE